MAMRLIGVNQEHTFRKTCLFLCKDMITLDKNIRVAKRVICNKQNRIEQKTNTRFINN